MMQDGSNGGDPSHNPTISSYQQTQIPIPHAYAQAPGIPTGPIAFHPHQSVPMTSAYSLPPQQYPGVMVSQYPACSMQYSGAPPHNPTAQQQYYNFVVPGPPGPGPAPHVGRGGYGNTIQYYGNPEDPSMGYSSGVGIEGNMNHLVPDQNLNSINPEAQMNPNIDAYSPNPQGYMPHMGKNNVPSGRYPLVHSNSKERFVSSDGNGNHNPNVEESVRPKYNNRGGRGYRGRGGPRGRGDMGGGNRGGRQRNGGGGGGGGSSFSASDHRHEIQQDRSKILAEAAAFMATGGDSAGQNRQDDGYTNPQQHQSNGRGKKGNGRGGRGRGGQRQYRGDQEDEKREKDMKNNLMRSDDPQSIGDYQSGPPPRFERQQRGRGGQRGGRKGQQYVDMGSNGYYQNNGVENHYGGPPQDNQYNGPPQQSRRGRRGGKNDNYRDHQQRYNNGYAADYESKNNEGNYYQQSQNTNSRQADTRTFSEYQQKNKVPDRELNDNNDNKQCEDDRTRRERLIEQLTRGIYECMVCCDPIKQQHAIWSCKNCHNCFHLGCIKKWAGTSQEG